MAGSGHAANFAVLMELRSQRNYKSMVAFAGALAVLACVVISFHLLRVAGQGRGKPSFLAVVSRKVRRVTIRKAPCLPSVGHAAVICVYFAINIVVLFTNMDNKAMGIITNIASRAGWMAISNLVLVIFLALKNTPLAFLTSWSYERLNVLHQVAGYVAVTFVVIHASLYTSYFVGDGRREKMLEFPEICAMVAGLSFLIMAFAGGIIRRWWYELFYYLHISFWMVAIVMVGLHQPVFAEYIVYLTCVAGGMWALDRLVRLVRLILYSTNNSVTLTPLPHGGTRVSLKKPPVGAVSGKHCFLWIPKVRSCETHPFTIAAMDPLEFVVASYDGFTRDLHSYAVANPGVSLTASIEGAYGTFPDPLGYDTVVLVAGGSGASFTFGMALNMLNKLKEGDKRHIVFIWMVKNRSYLEWYSSHLATLNDDSRVTLQLFVTRSPPLQIAMSNPESELKKDAVITECETIPEKRVSRSLQPKASTISIDSEQTIPSETDTSSTGDEFDFPAQVHGIPVTYTRPHVAPLIHNAVDDTAKDKRVLVLGCGPDSLMKRVRNTTAECIRPEGPGVELHCEQFGW